MNNQYVSVVPINPLIKHAGVDDAILKWLIDHPRRRIVCVLVNQYKAFGTSPTYEPTSITIVSEST